MEGEQEIDARNALLFTGTNDNFKVSPRPRVFSLAA